MEGKKFDEQKLKLATFYPDFANAFRALVQVAQYGAQKYNESGNIRNWEILPNGISRLKNSLFRHLDAYLTGEFYDSESGFPHLAHLLWNGAILYELEKRAQETN